MRIHVAWARLIYISPLSAMSTASSRSSVMCTSSGSSGLIMPASITGPLSQSNRPYQYSLPTSTRGMRLTLCVCTNVRTSNISSSVPKPPGNTMAPELYLTNMVLRTKK